MSKYTMQLREIYSPTLQFKTPFYTKNEVENWFSSYNLTDYLTSEEISVINERGTWSKEKLGRKIVNHYAMREIGFETIGLFREKAKIFMEELMEEYLPLIYSASIYYDPLVNVDYTESYEREATNEGSNTSSTTGRNTSNSSSSGLNVQSDTPQGQISKTAILAGSYASQTGANENTIEDVTNSVSSGEASNENTLNEEYTKRVKGNSGVSATAQKMIEQYRNNIRAIDKEIIEKCNVLFMGIF